MNLQEFVTAFEEELQLPAGSVAPTTALRDISRFDSMGRLLFMNMVEFRFGTVVAAAAIDRCTTIADLHATVCALIAK